jgi:adenylate kinase family enzyme
MQDYEVQLDNRGNIEARYQLIPPKSLFGSKFSFFPQSGTLAPVQSQKIGIEFLSNVIGQFDEKFVWKVDGRTQDLVLNFRGQVIGPSFQIDVNEIDFGTVSFNFVNTKIIHLTNTCEIPMKFNLRVPEDGTLLQREFSLIPQSGTINPDSSKEVRIDFLSNTLKRYNANLVIDVEDVGDSLEVIPIRADCIVPEVLLSSGKINFGDCFIGYPYSQTLDLGNNSNQPAKYEVILPSDNEKNKKVVCTVDEFRGVVPSNATHNIKVTIVTKIVGSIYVPIYVRIVGSEKPPFEVSVSALSVGPIVQLETEKIDWGKVDVLKEHVKTVRLFNKSPIPAPFKLSFSKGSDKSNFKVSNDLLNGGVIGPASAIDIPVSITPDEAMKFADDLIIEIQNGEKLTAKLIANGKGSSIVLVNTPKQGVEQTDDLSLIDLKNQFTSKNTTHTFTLSNMGRKTQVLQWYADRKKNMGDTKSKRENGEKPVEVIPIFKIKPEKSTIPPRSVQVYTVEGVSAREGPVSEFFFCKSAQKQIYSTEVRSNFCSPAIKLSESSMMFSYTYSADNLPSVETRPLSITNVSPLTLIINLKPTGPFSVDRPDITLAPGESQTIQVLFDPAFKNDKLSVQIKTKLQITYKDHPQKDTIDLNADINYPNLDISTNVVDFSSILSNTEKRRNVDITNNGTVDVNYVWMFDQLTTTGDDVPTFDILPIKGTIAPKQKETIEFIYNGAAQGGSNKAVAICQVEGGPEYEVQLKGESSSIKYTLEESNIDFGLVPYYQQQEHELTIVNNGKVMFDYEFDLSKRVQKGTYPILEVSPMSGRLKAGEKLRILVRLIPGVPETIEESFKLQISHFEPEIITVRAIALYPTVNISALGSPVETLLQEHMDNAVKAVERGTHLMAQAMTMNPAALQSGARLPKNSEYDTQKEAERLAFKKYMAENPNRSLSATGGKKRQDSRPHSSISRGASSAGLAAATPTADLVVATYICDFGNTIKGVTKKKTFKINNAGILPVSFQFDKKELAKNGLMVEPSEIKRMPGYPDNQVQSLDLFFHSKHKKIQVGPYSCVIPMQLENSYVVNFEVRANVIIPEVEISTTNLEFGHLFVGFASVIVVQLENKKEIPCEWALDLVPPAKQPGNTKPPQINNGADAFICKTNRGVLQSGEKVNVEITFVPDSKKKYSQVIQLKCTNNPKPKKIMCTGAGQELDIVIEPGEINLGPVLPHTDTDYPFVVTNNSSCDIDFYSLDFDKKYVEDEDVLLYNADQFVDGYLSLPPRTPGEPLVLPEQFIRNYEDRNKGETAERGSTPAPDEQSTFNLRSEENLLSSAGLQVSMSTESDIEKRAFVIHGPPFSGKTTVAHSISARLKIPILAVDHLIDEHKNNNPDLNVAYETSLYSIIQQRITREDCVQGFIFDGLDSVYMPMNHVIFNILKACHPMAPILITLSIDETSIRMRGVTARRDELKREVEKNKVEQITEEEFEELSENEKRDYELRLRKVRENTKKLKELNAKAAQLAIELGQAFPEQQAEDVAEDIITAMHRRIKEDKEYLAKLKEEEAKNKKNAPKKKPVTQPPTKEAPKGGKPNATLPTAPVTRGKSPVQESPQPTDTSALPPYKTFEDEIQITKKDDPMTVRLKQFKQSYYKIVDLCTEGFREDMEVNDPMAIQPTPETTTPVPTTAGGNRNKQAPSRDKKVEKSRSYPKVYLCPIVGKSEEDARAEIFNAVVELSPFLNAAVAITEPGGTVQANTKPDIYLPIPDPYILQRIPLPVRKPLEVVKNFTIMQAIKVIKRLHSSQASEPPTPKAGSQTTRSKNEPEEKPQSPDLKPQTTTAINIVPATRWLIRANQSQELIMRFRSPNTGTVQRTFQFGVSGRKLRFQLKCKGVCAYPQMSTYHKTIFTRPIKNKPEGKYVSKKFVFATKTFEYGPLLVRPNSQYEERKSDKPELDFGGYNEQFHITNNGLFDAEVSFALEHKDDKENNFIIEPTTLQLKKEQTQDITVWALPRKVGELRNAVVCTIKDNPIPFKFDVLVIGSKPKVEVDRKVVDFGRLLLSNKTSTEKFTITNVATIPVLWKLQPPTSGKFTVEPLEGKLELGEKCDVTVSFNANEACEPHDQIVLSVTDQKQLSLQSGDIIEVPITISAEAYNLEVEVDHDADFGTVKVADQSKKSITLFNNGKYDVCYMFKIPKNLEKYFTVTPQEGILQSKAKTRTSVDIEFHSSHEKTFKNLKDIECKILDLEKKVNLGSTQIKIDVKSVFSKYSIMPPHGINFGPLTFDKEKQRTFEISNEGAFDINYTLFAFKDGFHTNERASSAKGNKNDRPKSQGKQQPLKTPKGSQPKKELMLGNFRFEPAVGVIAPGSKASITVTFSGKTTSGAQVSRQLLGIDISDRNTNDNPDGIEYDVQGEVCVPGITTTDFESIFEEQQIVTAMSKLQSDHHSVFCVEERVFSFGTIAAGSTKTKATEKFKITNPFKVPCNVECSIKPRDSSDTVGVSAFDVQPAKQHIPPHEHRYVYVYFCPPSLHNYSALFEAIVTDGKDPKTNELKIELRGDGSLPQVAIKAPTERGDDNCPILRFPRTILGKREQLPVSIYNEGVLPATVRFDFPNKQFAHALTFPDRSKEFVLESKQSIISTMFFEPTQIEKIDTTMNMVVLDNHFEDTTIRILAEGYEEDITFDELPEGKDQELLFGDCEIGQPNQKTFLLVNRSDHHVRFKWNLPENVTILPKIGHLHARSSKNVTVTFVSHEPKQYKGEPMTLNLERIKYTGDKQDWDDRQITVKWVQVDEEEEERKRLKKLEEEEEAKQSKQKGKRPSSQLRGRQKTPQTPKQDDSVEVPSTPSENAPKKLVTKRVEEVDPEPACTVVTDITPALANKDLKVFATADYAKYECNVEKVVEFSLTKMFETRAYTFNLKNTGKVALAYKWSQEEIPENPFSISPMAGTLAVEESALFTVKYCPVDVPDGEYHSDTLMCKINNVDKTLPSPLTVTLHGKSVCPIVHFQLDASDYLSSGRRNPELPTPSSNEFGSLDKNVTRVIEINSCGIKIRIRKRFYILNPTDSSYDYQWTRVSTNNLNSGDVSQQATDVFTCINRKGTIHSGKKSEIIFEYVPTTLDTCESFWLFSIPSKKINVPFLVVGHAKEPELSLDTARVNFQTVLVGAKAKQTIHLVNREKIPFSFSLEQSVFKSETSPNGPKILTVTPSHGTVGAEEQLPLKLVFVPGEESSYNFQLAVNVKKKPTLLTCNVKGEGFAIHEKMEVDGLIQKPNEPNRIDFGRAQINEKKIKTIVIHNDGDYNYDFQWYHGIQAATMGSGPQGSTSQSSSGLITIDPEVGTVSKREKAVCKIMFEPKAPVSMENYKCVCKITNGSTYTLLVAGNGAQPKITFSFTEFDFGPNFLVQQGMKPKETVLKITNQDEKDISYELLYENKPHLEVEAAATVLKTGKSSLVPIRFRPRELKQYREVVTFEINALYKINVVITGEGTPSRVELVNMQDKTINFGALRKGESAQRSIALVNKSKIPLQLTFPEDMYQKLLKSFVTLSLRADRSQTVQPVTDSRSTTTTEKKEGLQPVILAPKGTCNIDVAFKPESRQNTFTHEISADVEGGKRKLLATVTGACQGIEVKLSTTTLAFGPVVQHTQVVRKLNIENTGDIGVKFKWNPKHFEPEFTIHPSQGFVPANGEVILDITYIPTVVQQNAQYDNLECKIDGSKSLFLNLTGLCVSKPPEREKVTFNVNVRQTQVKKISVPNQTKGDWRLKSVFDNRSWRGPEYLDVPAGATREYEITYSPKKMIKNEEGSLFFPLPDGKAFLYSLVGTADDPLPAGDIKRDLAAKEQHVEHLWLENWLEEAQRFRVITDDFKVEPPNQLTAVPNYIDVPSMSKREYKLMFLPFKEGSYEGKVTFLNESTKEFVFYNIKYTVKPSKLVKVLQFESRIRQRVSQTISIDNPLNRETKLNIKCANLKHLFITPPLDQPLVIPANRTGKVEVVYLPLTVETDEERDLVIQNDELGQFPYKLKLTGTPTGPEKNVHFKVSLGNSQTQTIRFINYWSQSPIEYAIKLQSNNFSLVEQQGSKGVIKVQPATGPDGTEESMDIAYEPSVLGDCKDKLVLSSKQGGEYVFLLFGHCTAPAPQGPIEILSNGTAVIQFKNVLNNKADFKFTVDTPSAFSIKPDSISLASKQKQQVTISFKGVPPQNTSTMHKDVLASPKRGDGGASVHAKLTVTCKDNPTTWVYYLLGKTAK